MASTLSSENFEGFGLTQVLLKRIKEEIKISKPTKVQAECIPEILKGRNCIAHAPTGSGKTMAFAIPMIQKWSKDPHGVYGLVLTPTRELGHQIKDQISFLGGSPCKVSIITGGVDYQKQALELTGQPHFVVATPGRLADLMANGGNDFKKIFKNVRYLVLDEADRLLHEQFEAQVEYIIKFMPQNKQTLFFSATIADHKMMKESMLNISGKTDDPFVYSYQKDENDSQSTSTDESTEKASSSESVPLPLLCKQNIVQRYITTPRDFKDGYMMELLRSIRDDKTPPDIRSMIIFATTCRECRVLSVLLTNMGFSNVSLNSGMDQKSRLKALSDFKSSQVTTLIATDVASRGLDIKTVDLVINYSVPMPEDYVHRVGRTGRHTQTGLALTLIVPPRDIQFLTNIEAYIRANLTEMKMDERKVLLILTDVQTQRKLADISVSDPDPFVERANKKRKTETNFDEVD